MDALPVRVAIFGEAFAEVGPVSWPAGWPPPAKGQAVRVADCRLRVRDVVWMPRGDDGVAGAEPYILVHLERGLGDGLIEAARSLLGQMVLVTLERHTLEFGDAGGQPFNVETGGRLVALSEDGEVTLIDADGVPRYCWPMLDIRAAE